MRLYGLIGFPLSHSFSKKYFDEKFEKEKLTGCRFENFPIDTINDLPYKVLQQHPDLLGLAVTIPYKHQVLRYLDDASHIPEGLKACNCIVIKNGLLTGYNTDHIGFAKSLQPLLKPHHKQALILGNGGATDAVRFALRKMGIGYIIAGRTLHDDTHFTYEQLNDAIIQTHTIIINTTPLGMYPHTDTCPAIPYDSIGADHLLYDLVYNPAKTLFLQKGEERGAIIKNGEEMLVLQAEENWKIWNGG